MLVRLHRARIPLLLPGSRAARVIVTVPLSDAGATGEGGAAARGRTTAQLLLRWSIQPGVVTTPCSKNAALRGYGMTLALLTGNVARPRWLRSPCSTTMESGSAWADVA